MSAHVLEDEEFQALHTALRLREGDKWEGAFRFRVRDHDGTYEDLVASFKVFTARELVTEWYSLNLKAIDDRYGEGTAAADGEPEALPATVFQLTSRFLNLSDGALYGLLSCLHYQCSEGVACDDPAYKRLTEFRFYVADLLAKRHPDYQWGLKDA